MQEDKQKLIGKVGTGLVGMGWEKETEWSH